MNSPIPESVDGGSALRLLGFQQGDVLPAVHELAVQGEGGPEAVNTPLGVVITTQTCDVIRDGLPYVHVAPRVQLVDSAAKQAATGRRPRYAHLPALGGGNFADLTHMSSMRKSHVALLERIPGVVSDEEISKFGKAVARHFNRFAFPGVVSEYLSPFADSIQSKAGKLESYEGQAIERVLQLRLESINGWRQPPYDLRLLIIVEPGTLPMFAGDEIPVFDDELYTWLYDAEAQVRRSPHEIAQRLESEQSAANRYYLWSGLGDAWVARCGAGMSNADSDHTTAPAITSEVISADEFSLTRMLTSELLDLDHLSRADGQPV
ncbi:hypothetical protein [Mycolicibacterium sp.]|uniref:hypothetical protein n=1 Tax=Mycolicibacterium sp. TaxID=2320850 RepID=UPI001A1FCFEC|nr:hypothetical protein [Mycolicibacterium sp.]MBJ7337146.1 hypothetical protein [Mycolicibacterium sp.]